MKSNTKKLSFAALGTLLIVGALFASSIGIQPIYANGDSQDSESSVEFTAPDTTDPVKPVDPTNPTEPLDPVDPGDGNETGSVGALTIDYVPHFRFGSTMIDGSIKTLMATSQKPFVQVSDRRATGKGWELSATMGNFINGSHSIDDATIKLKDGKIKTTDDTTTTGSPTGSNLITLTSNGSKVSIMNAQAGEGMGTWLMAWLNEEGTETNSNVELTINTKDALVGTYESQINWTLAQQP